MKNPKHYGLLSYTKNERINDFVEIMYENLCQPCVIQPTRIVDKQKPSLIDNIFINSIENPISGNLLDKISDHFPNFIIINKYSEKKEKK